MFRAGDEDPQDQYAKLLGAAFFLELDRPVQKEQQYGEKFWFRHPDFKHRPAEYIKGVLDSFALLLVPRPGAAEVTACSLDWEIGAPENRPTSKTPPTKRVKLSTSTSSIGENNDMKPIRLRIARNGVFSRRNERAFQSHAELMIAYLRTGNAKSCKELFPRLLLYCEEKIKDCLGLTPQRTKRLDVFRSTVQLVHITKAPSFLDNFENHPWGAAPPKPYTRENSGEAFEYLQAGLKFFLDGIDDYRPNDGAYLIHMVKFAQQFRNQKVLFELLHEALQDEQQFKKAKKYIERVSQYHQALSVLSSVVRRRIKDGYYLLEHPTEVIFTSPKVMAIGLPPLKQTLLPWVVEPRDVPSVQIPDNVYHEYQQAMKRFEAKEHCEIQLVRFYLENPAVVPLLEYIGVSKFCCFMCAEFLKELQNPFHGGGDVASFGVRGNHGKIYGRWLPPIKIEATEKVQAQVAGALDSISFDIWQRFRKRIQELLVPVVGGNSPAYSSGENDDSEDDSIDDFDVPTHAVWKRK